MQFGMYARRACSVCWPEDCLERSESRSVNARRGPARAGGDGQQWAAFREHSGPGDGFCWMEHKAPVPMPWAAAWKACA